MSNARLIDTVLNVARTPALAPYLRTQPLPLDLLLLIRAAGGCSRSIATLTSQTTGSFAVLKPAISFYLQEILFGAEADPYRNLGVGRDASREVMRTHMRWLLLWLHPDRNHHEEAQLFSAQVIKAWHTLRAGEQDALQPASASFTPSKVVTSRPRVRWIAVPLSHSKTAKRTKRRRLLKLSAAAIILIGGMCIPTVSPTTLSSLKAFNIWAFAK